MSFLEEINFKISYDLWLDYQFEYFIHALGVKTLFMCMNLFYFVFLAKGKFFGLHHFDLDL